MGSQSRTWLSVWTTTKGVSEGFPGGSDSKESAHNAGELGSIPGWGRSPGEGNGNPLLYSCLENSIVRGAWRAIVHEIANRHDKASQGFPGGSSGKESACECRRSRRCCFGPWVGKMPWKRKWQPAPVFLPGESHGQRSLAGCSPWGRKESDTTEATQHAHMLKSVYVSSVSSASWTTASTSPNIQVQDPLPTNLLTQKGQTPPLSSSGPHSIWGRSTPWRKVKKKQEQADEWLYILGDFSIFQPEKNWSFWAKMLMSPANRNYHNRTIDILINSPPAILALMITKSSTAVQAKIETQTHTFGTTSVQTHAQDCSASVFLKTA